ncbi:Zip-domain-containing protein [Cutaneotrichosporon oleaginosum]|uniref:Zip-domain-containing protein n=1 Tax=Cutaneotrichosporon oleaginosum TaxID=879819 RepID=A0A0J1AZX9_9TREE|nr:Zip-domain-containing protein [Cutaneotrichosporon oleaginosum]KLT40889.1 Zip-domain-containing protein [Cutaneotrichosporon oleaginosum]TXT09252.1 hypothetical protein COLE_03186 [Cutaneotrichosporon oleaginosum]
MRCAALLVVLAASVARAQSPTTTSSASPSIPSPTGRGECTWHINHWDCEQSASSASADDHDDHEGHSDEEHSASGTAAAAAAVPSPTDRGACTFHVDHWDCEKAAGTSAAASGPEAEAEAAAARGECIIHAGHTHGDCSEAQLACGAVLLEHYDMPLHIGAVFIILVTTAIGCFVPIMTGWTRRNDKLTGALDASSFGRDVGFLGNVLFIARHFGTGIILSTAFIHLLYHGFLMFNNKCLGELVYGPTSPAIAMAAALVTFLFDFLGGRTGHRRLEAAHAAGTSSPDTASGDEEKNARAPVVFDTGCSHAEAVFRQEQDWQVLLLEAGILFHSIMIGVTLGAGSGPGWTTLLIVIVFHQFFEAAALGSRIALLYWISRARALVMGAAFILITPIGVGIGIGVRKSFAQNGKASLLAIGILNSVSAGILMYTAFRLLSGDFTEGPLRRGKWSAVVASLTAMFVGLISMSILGKWA